MKARSNQWPPGSVSPNKLRTTRERKEVVANKKTKKSKSKSVRDLSLKNTKGSAVKGGLSITKKIDISSPNFFRNAVSGKS